MIVVLVATACAPKPATRAPVAHTLELYVKALERADYPAAAALLVDDGRFGEDLPAVAARLQAGGEAVLEEARALLKAAREPGAVRVEEVAELGSGRELRTRR